MNWTIFSDTASALFLCSDLISLENPSPSPCRASKRKVNFIVELKIACGDIIVDGETKKRRAGGRPRSSYPAWLGSAINLTPAARYSTREIAAVCGVTRVVVLAAMRKFAVPSIMDNDSTDPKHRVMAFFPAQEVLRLAEQARKLNRSGASSAREEKEKVVVQKRNLAPECYPPFVFSLLKLEKKRYTAQELATTLDFSKQYVMRVLRKCGLYPRLVNSTGYYYQKDLHKLALLAMKAREQVQKNVESYEATETGGSM